MNSYIRIEIIAIYYSIKNRFKYEAESIVFFLNFNLSCIVL